MAQKFIVPDDDEFDDNADENDAPVFTTSGPKKKKESFLSKAWRVANTPMADVSPEMRRVMEQMEKDYPYAGKLGNFGVDTLVSGSSPLGMGLEAATGGSAAVALSQSMRGVKGLTKAARINRGLGKSLGAATGAHGAYNIEEGVREGNYPRAAAGGLEAIFGGLGYAAHGAKPEGQRRLGPAPEGTPRFIAGDAGVAENRLYEVTINGKPVKVSPEFAAQFGLEQGRPSIQVDPASVKAVSDAITPEVEPPLRGKKINVGQNKVQLPRTKKKAPIFKNVSPDKTPISTGFPPELENIAIGEISSTKRKVSRQSIKSETGAVGPGTGDIIAKQRMARELRQMAKEGATDPEYKMLANDIDPSPLKEGETYRGRLEGYVGTLTPTTPKTKPVESQITQDLKAIADKPSLEAQYNQGRASGQIPEYVRFIDWKKNPVLDAEPKATVEPLTESAPEPELLRSKKVTALQPSTLPENIQQQSAVAEVEPVLKEPRNFRYDKRGHITGRFMKKDQPIEADMYERGELNPKPEPTHESFLENMRQILKERGSKLIDDETGAIGRLSAAQETRDQKLKDLMKSQDPEERKRLESQIAFLDDVPSTRKTERKPAIRRLIEDETGSLNTKSLGDLVDKVRGTAPKSGLRTAVEEWGWGRNVSELITDKAGKTANYSSRDKTLLSRLRLAGIDTKGKNVRSPSLWKAVADIDPKAGKMMENHFSRSPEGLHTTANIVSGTKNIALTGGLPGRTGQVSAHGFNIAKSDIMAQGFKKGIKNYFSGSVDPEVSLKFRRDNAKIERELVEHGYTPVIEEHAVSGQNPTKLDKVPYVGKANLWRKKVFEDPLFRVHLPALKLKQALGKLAELEPQLGRKEALKRAAAFANDFSGSVDTTFRNKTYQDIARVGLLAPSWLESRFNVARKGITGHPDYIKPMLRGAALSTPKMIGAATVGKGIIDYLTKSKAAESTGIPAGEVSFDYKDDKGRKRTATKQRNLDTTGTAVEPHRFLLNSLTQVSQGDLLYPIRYGLNKASIPLSTAKDIWANEDPYGNALTGKDRFGRPIKAGKAFGNIAQELSRPITPTLVQAIIDYYRGKGSAEEIGSKALELPINYSFKPKPKSSSSELGGLK